MHSMEKEGGNPLNQITCANWTSFRVIIANSTGLKYNDPLNSWGWHSALIMSLEPGAVTGSFLFQLHGDDLPTVQGGGNN